MDHLISVYRFTVVGVLNGGQLGSANAGGAGAGSVVDNTAIGQGTGIANAGPGKIQIISLQFFDFEIEFMDFMFCTQVDSVSG